MLVGTRWSRASTTARTRRATTPLATTMSTEHDKRFHSSHFKITIWVTIKFNHWDSIDFDHQEGNSLTGVRGSYTGAAGNTIHYVADQWGFRLVWRKYPEWKQTKRFFCFIFPSPRDASSVAVFVVRYLLMYYTQFRDGQLAMRMREGCLSEKCAAFIALYPTYVGYFGYPHRQKSTHGHP